MKLQHNNEDPLGEKVNREVSKKTNEKCGSTSSTEETH